MTNTQHQGGSQALARYAAWRRVGDLIYLSGVIAVDVTGNRIIRGYADLPPEVAEKIGRTGQFSVDAIEEPILAQSWYVLHLISGTMEAAGGEMANVFKLVQYFKDLNQFPYYARMRNLFFPDRPPVSTVVQVSGMLPSPEMLIEVEATAYLPSR